MKYRTLRAVLIFFLGIAMIVQLLTWVNPIERRWFGFEGKGTRFSPYKISSVEDLERFRDLVNSGESFPNVFFEQTKDLDLIDIGNWVPIGIYGDNQYFYGTYNGAGHTICNLTIIGNENSGLFGLLEGEVRNLGIESGYIEGACVGSIASHGSGYSSIINCYNKAAIHGMWRAGGIADNLGGGSIKYCWNLGEVRADSGGNYGISSYSAQIDGCCCIDLLPAPEEGCMVSNTVTFTLEELEDIYNGRELYEDARGDMQQIGTDGQTVAFVREERYAKLVEWLKTYWVLLLLAGCSVVLYFIASESERNHKLLNDGEKTEPNHDSCNSCIGGFDVRNKILYVTLFFIVLFGGIRLLDQTLMIYNTEGVDTMRNYYKQPKDSVDVLFLGSSRVGRNLDLETLWKYYGISGYFCWGSRQPFWNSYYFLKEAVSVSRPEVVALEVGAATYSFEYSDDYQQYANTYGLKNIQNRIQAVQVSAPQSRWNDLISGFPIHHSRFNELTRQDFIHFFWITDSVNFKGNSVRYGSGDYDLADVSGITETKKIKPKEEIYFRKIIEYCQNEEIPIFLFASPHPSRIAGQPYFNAVQEIADEYGISFINFNLLDAETGFEAEDFWTDGHMNTSGGRKVALYLGKYIMSNYMLLDHRGDEKYKSWDVFSDNMENEYLRQITEADDYFAELVRDGRTAVIMKRNIPEESEAYAYFLQKIAGSGFDLRFLEEDGRSCYVVNVAGNQQYDCTQETNLNIDGMNVTIDFFYSDTVSIDGDSVYTLPASGVVCMAYDSFAKRIVDIAVFSEDTQYTAVHQ